MGIAGRQEPMFDENLYFNCAAISRLMEREWTAAYAPLNLTPSQAIALRALLASPGCTPTRLAKVLVVGRPTASRLVEGLCKKQLVVRRYGQLDGRECELFPTSLAIDMKSALEMADTIATRNVSRRVGAALARTASECMHDLREQLLAISDETGAPTAVRAGPACNDC